MFNNVGRISRQLFAYGTADVFVLAISFLLLPIYTRVLTPREYGALALLLVFEAVLKIVNRWGLDAAFLRFYYERPSDEQRKTLAGTIVGFIALANGAHRRDAPPARGADQPAAVRLARVHLAVPAADPERISVDVPLSAVHAAAHPGTRAAVRLAHLHAVIRHDRRSGCCSSSFCDWAWSASLLPTSS